MKLIKKILLILTILVSTSAFSQLTRNYGKEADVLWESGKYVEAADAYKKASDKMPVKTEKSRITKAGYAYRSAECYKLIHDFPNAEEQYEKSILLKQQEVEPKVYYYLAEMQMSQGEHKKAEGNYKKYKELNSGDPLTDVRIQSCKEFKHLQKDKTRHELNQLTKLNSTAFDFGAVMNSRGTAMYFTSSRSASTGSELENVVGGDFTDIFVSEIDRKGNFGEPTLLSDKVNTIDNEGSLCFDGRGKTMFFTRCRREEKKNLGCDIYMVEVKSKKFGDPVKLEIKDHDSTHVGHPAASDDGKTLIFASNMAGGEGGVDLWMTTYDKKADSWSLPTNLGPEINTAGNDMFPIWAKDGSLYYSTDGLVGAGGLDVFVATQVGTENKWEKPTNMGAPLNTYADDYNLIFTQKDVEGQKGYLSSNRAGSKGSRTNPSQDIWSFYLPPVLVNLYITIVDQETREGLPDMEVRVVGSDGSNYSLMTDMDGQLSMTELEDKTRMIKPGHTFTIEVPGQDKVYLGGKDNFTTVGVETQSNIVREIGLLNIEKPIRLPEVRYPLGKATLLVDSTFNSKDSLNFLYEVMIDNPNIVVKLLSHTDARGSNSANLALSKRRAQSCVDYLVNEKGLPADRFVPTGAGETSPTSINDIDPISGDTTVIVLTEKYINQFKKTDKARFDMLHQKNRRTEGEIISTDYVAKSEAAIDGE
jgi:peptidoglycan-associated lipoprotein